jgi:hypothetical protein
MGDKRSGEGRREKWPPSKTLAIATRDGIKEIAETVCAIVANPGPWR